MKVMGGGRRKKQRGSGTSLEGVVAVGARQSGQQDQYCNPR